MSTCLRCYTCINCRGTGTAMEDPEKLRAQARAILAFRTNKCVERIVADLSDRSGLGDAWWDIDPGVRVEILTAWHAIVLDTLEKT